MTKNPKDITMWDTFIQTFGCSFAPLLILAAVLLCVPLRRQ